MQDFGVELATGPSQVHNRDLINSVELKNLLRNSSLVKFFHTAMHCPDELWPGIIMEDDTSLFIGLEDYDRISEE